MHYSRVISCKNLSYKMLSNTFLSSSEQIYLGLMHAILKICCKNANIFRLNIQYDLEKLICCQICITHLSLTSTNECEWALHLCKWETIYYYWVGWRIRHLRPVWQLLTEAMWQSSIIARSCVLHKLDQANHFYPKNWNKLIIIMNVRKTLYW